MNEVNEIAKALQDIAKVVENNPTVENVKVIINLKKPKPSKATKESQ